MRKAHAQGKEDPLTWAVKEAIDRKILPDYLERKATEVVNMLTMEYDYAVDIAAQKEGSFDEGLEEGRLETVKAMMSKFNLTLKEVMDALNIPASERGVFASRLS